MAKKKIKDQPSLDVHVLLDRTGSMASDWLETITAVNAYGKKVVGDDDVAVRVAVTVFDYDEHQTKIEPIREYADHWTKIDPDECPPRGYTPLFDAMGIVLTAMRGEKRPKDRRCQFIVMTDGQENASREWTKERVQKLLAEVRNDTNWSVVFLGADMDAVKYGTSLGVAVQSTATFDKSSIAETMTTNASASLRFAASGASVNYSDADRELMLKVKKKR